MIKSESTFKTFVINGNLDEEFEEKQNLCLQWKKKNWSMCRNGKVEKRKLFDMLLMMPSYIDLYIDDIVCKRIYVKKS